MPITPRACLIATVVLLITISAVGFDSYISGEMVDRFAGELVKPAGVDVYVFDADKANEITALLHKMHGLLTSNSEKDEQEYFDAYGRLVERVSKTQALSHTKSDKEGRFTFRGLPQGRKIIVLGIQDREDSTTYYADKELQNLLPGKNAVTLDFNSGSPCAPPSTQLMVERCKP